MGSPIPRPRVSDEYSAAMLPLQVRRDQHGATPCQSDPEMWDDRLMGESWDEMMYRTLAAIDRCMDCAALVECISFRDTNARAPIEERVHGVLGGVLVTQARPVGRPRSR